MPLFVVIRIEEHEQQSEVDHLGVLASVEVADMNLAAALYTATVSAHADATSHTASWIAARQDFLEREE